MANEKDIEYIEIAKQIKEDNERIIELMEVEGYIHKEGIKIATNERFNRQTDLGKIYNNDIE